MGKLGPNDVMTTTFVRKIRVLGQNYNNQHRQRGVKSDARKLNNEVPLNSQDSFLKLKLLARKILLFPVSSIYVRTFHAQSDIKPSPNRTNVTNTRTRFSKYFQSDTSHILSVISYSSGVV